MFNLLKSDVYRLVHGKLIWVLLMVNVAVIIVAAGALWWSSTPEFAQMINEQAAQNMAGKESTSVVYLANENGSTLTPEEAAILNEAAMGSHTHMYAQVLISGGFLATLISLFAALFFMSDFDSGFAKNVLAGRLRRSSYFAEKLVLCALMCAVFLLVSILVSEVAFAVAGFTFDQVENVGQYVGWVVLAWLSLVVYALATAVIEWTVRSKAVGIVFAIVASGGVLASVVTMAAALLSPAIPLLATVAEWIPANNFKLLGSGATDLFSSGILTSVNGLADPAHIAVVSGVVIAVCAVLALTVCKRKDV